MSRRFRASVPLLAAFCAVVGPRFACGQNLVSNPHFDTSTAGWSGTFLTFDSTNDANGAAPSSGSAKSVTIGGVVLTCANQVSQCVTGLVAGQTYSLGGKTFMPVQTPFSASSRVTLDFTSDPACAVSTGPIVYGPTVTAQGSWLSSDTAAAVAPPGTTSALLSGEACVSTALNPFQINYDDMFLSLAPALAVPALDGLGLLALASVLAGAAVLALRLRSRSG